MSRINIAESSSRKISSINSRSKSDNNVHKKRNCSSSSSSNLRSRYTSILFPAGIVVAFYILSMIQVIRADCASGKTIINVSDDIENLSEGVITDGQGKYPEQFTCQWLINSVPIGPANVTYKPITLSFSFYDTECSYDFVFVYDGMSRNAPKLASLSGLLIPEPLVARSGSMLIVLYSDVNYNRDGFVANYTVSDCPLDCSGRGTCDPSSGMCACFPGFEGFACQVEACPNNCNADANQGECDLSRMICNCAPGFGGVDCSDPTKDGAWTHLFIHTPSDPLHLSNDDVFVRGYALHASVYDDKRNIITVFGGTSPLHEESNAVLQYNLTSNTAKELLPSTDFVPEPRFSHTAVLYRPASNPLQPLMIVYGGMSQHHISNDIESLNTVTGEWSHFSVSGSPVPALTGHTATLVGLDLMIIIGGKSLDDAFPRSIYSLNLTSSVLSKMQVGGELAPGVYGHSAVYIPSLNAILVYGGIRPAYGFYSYRVNDLWMLHLDSMHWIGIRYSNANSFSPRPSAFHAAWMTSNGDMVVHGGYIHSHGGDSRCFGNDMIVYKPSCNIWYSVPYRTNSTIPRARFGHAVNAIGDDKFVMTGGFNGVSQSDVWQWSTPTDECASRLDGSLSVDSNQYGVNDITFSQQCTRNPICSACIDEDTASSICFNSSEPIPSGCLSANVSSSPLVCGGLCATINSCMDCAVVRDCSWCGSLSRCISSSDLGSACEASTLHSNVSRCLIDAPGFGNVALERWYGVGGELVSDLLGFTTTYPHLPDFTTTSPALEAEFNPAASLGQRLRGILLAPETGNYQFFIASDKGSQLSISLIPDVPASVASLTILSTVLRSSEFRNFFQFPTQASGEVFLQAGKNYIIEVIHKQTEHPNIYFSVAWRLPSSPADSAPEILPPNHLRPYRSSYLHDIIPVSDAAVDDFLELNNVTLPSVGGYCNSAYISCYACLADASCAWCSASRKCVDRVSGSDGGDYTCPIQSRNIDPMICPICFDHTSCGVCASDSLCQWIGNACYQRGLWYISGGIQQPELCPIACRLRTNCTSCLANQFMSACQWCSSTQTCDDSYSYIATATLGQCDSWETSLGRCSVATCAGRNTCSQCLASPECGWCGFSSVNGTCMRGDFAGPEGSFLQGYNTCEGTTSAPLSSNESSLTLAPSLDANPMVEFVTMWLYMVCPDINECLLNMHNCHPLAFCTDLPGSFSCTCNSGYAGDGVIACNPVCDNIDRGKNESFATSCRHGTCIAPNVCQCSSEYTGPACDISCFCNGELNCTLALDCPDIDECDLGIDECHPDADCSNIPGSYACTCKGGYEGDGWTCSPICDPECVFGTCVAPSVCSCSYGYTGSICNLACNCNGLSNCDGEPNICPNCTNGNAMGSNCETCMPGYFGNPPLGIPCTPCDCNNFGDVSQNFCNPVDGICNCISPYTGNNCRQCIEGYYYSNTYKKCFSMCQGRKVLTQSRGNLGTDTSLLSYAPNSACQWVIFAEPTISAMLNETTMDSPEDTFAAAHKNQEREVHHQQSLAAERERSAKEASIVSLLQPEALKALHDIRSRRDSDSLSFQPYTLVPSTITLDFYEYSTECTYDYLFVFDGPSTSSPMLAAFSGSEKLPRRVIAKSGAMLVLFYSDVNYVLRGFEANFTVELCPNECSGHGVCNSTSAHCKCDAGFTGLDCSIPSCPNSCRPDLSPLNHCSLATEKCVCSPAFSGEDCSHSVTRALAWSTYHQNPAFFGGYMRSAERLAAHMTDTTSFEPRAGHCAVFDAVSNSIIIFGGYSLDAFYNSVLAFEIDRRSWSRLDETASDTLTSKPSPRQSHTCALHQATRRVYIFGGLDVSGSQVSDFWYFDLETKAWTNVSRSISDSLVIRSLMGHQSVFVADELYVIGGHSSNHGLTWRMTACKILENHTWYVPAAFGVIPRGNYAAQFWYSPATNSLVLQGGLRPVNFAYSMPSRSIHIYSLATRAWRLSPSRSASNEPPETYLHSGAVVRDGNYVVIYGGNSFIHGVRDRCMSNVLAIYSLQCNVWLQPPHDMSNSSISSRYGHASVAFPSRSVDNQFVAASERSNSEQIVVPEQVAIIGGFTGLPLGDIQVLSLPASFCNLYTTESLCQMDQYCAWCSRPNSGSSCIQIENFHNADCSNTYDNSASTCQVTCASRTSCDSCAGLTGCSWCGASSTCGSGSFTCGSQLISNNQFCPSHPCSSRVSCADCVSDPGCGWSTSQCVVISPSSPSSLVTTLDRCPLACSTIKNCSTCLDFSSLGCNWCQSTATCYETNAYIGAFAYGQCLEWFESKGNCSPDCSSATSCSSCLQVSGCGWCAEPGLLGRGECMNGDELGPSTGTCSGPFSVPIEENNSVTATGNYQWAYSMCPDEDECLLGRDNCEGNVTICVNTPTSFRCECPANYQLHNNVRCQAICNSGCINGVCVSPDVCVCNTGFFGQNCSIDCGCNGHSNCNKQGECFNCINNTYGDHCQYCLPGFTGNPKNGGSCISCMDKCNGHSNICDQVTGICFDCQNNTNGEYCHNCNTGYTRSNPNSAALCIPCQCNKHATTCHPINGQCDCQNETFGNNCDKCKRGWAGEPQDGRMCYLLIADDRVHGPDSLQQGMKRYYSVYPKFTNVDIRLTIDIISGSATVLVSPEFAEEIGVSGSQLFVGLNRRIDVVIPYQRFNFLVERFFISIYGETSDTSFVLYYSQRVTQIDLFVFFSVFFACFFLFLTIIIMAWKVHSYYDSRRAIAMRAIQLQVMASRPMASVLTFLSPIQKQLGIKGFHPLAIQPSSIGNAGFATVLVELPGPGTNAAAGFKADAEEENIPVVSFSFSPTAAEQPSVTDRISICSKEELLKEPLSRSISLSSSLSNTHHYNNMNVYDYGRVQDKNDSIEDDDSKFTESKKSNNVSGVEDSRTSTSSSSSSSNPIASTLLSSSSMPTNVVSHSFSFGTSLIALETKTISMINGPNATSDPNKLYTPSLSQRIRNRSRINARRERERQRQEMRGLF